MSKHIHIAALLAFLLTAQIASGATQKEIDAAIKKGSDSLKARYGRGPGGLPGLPGGGGGGETGIGPTCLAGIAMLEAGVPVNDDALKAITETVRVSSYTQSATYQVCLCLMYLDRLGDPADEPLIQMLAVRLLAAQTPGGGWGYQCAPVPEGDAVRLRAMKPEKAGKLHSEVLKYGQGLAAARANVLQTGGDDNSNTQFGVLAVWLARKHGVPVEDALDLIEKRFLASQNQNGGWAYSGGGPGMPVAPSIGASPSMYCAGLLGLATGIARREERRLKAEPAKPEPKTEPADPKKNPDDPFFNPPTPVKGDKLNPKKNPPRQPDARDRAVQAALAGLGVAIADSAKAGRGALVLGGNGGHGHHDLYFFWSLERIGVIYGLDKIGGVDWYEAGAQTLVKTQGPDGSWGGSYGAEVCTSFAVLFLCRSNLARDLSGGVQKETGTEMKAGAGPAGTEPKPTNPVAGGTSGTTGTTTPNPTPPPLVPGATGNEAVTIATELVRAADADWSKLLAKTRDAKGTVYTQALVGAVSKLDGDRRKEAREALAERLTRMTAATLREMAKNEDMELRRASVLAMAMKDDKDHIADLVTAISDDEDVVVRAARAGLKSLTGQDFGPAANATNAEKRIAVASWAEWLAKKQK